MPGVKGRSGGKRTPGPDAKPAGRPRSLVRTVDGEHAAVLRAGDTIALFDGAGITEATIELTDGELRLVNDKGQTLTIMLAD